MERSCLEDPRVSRDSTSVGDWGRFGAIFIYIIVTVTTIAGALLGLLASQVDKFVRSHLKDRQK